jgi:hypothetical protein
MVATQNDGIKSGYVYNNLINNEGDAIAGRHNNGVIFMQSDSFYLKESMWNICNLYNWGTKSGKMFAQQAYGSYYDGRKAFLFHEGIHATQQCISGGMAEWKIPSARQRYIEKLLLIIYFVFLCDKAKKVVSLGKFDVLVELAVATQPTAKK